MNFLNWNAADNGSKVIHVGLLENSERMLIYLMVTNNKIIASHFRKIYSGNIFANILEIIM
jgi:hypothetical protein